MGNDKITVIVPIYKTAKYLDKCIRSIINQTYKNLEIILINDGSPDDSLNICKMYADIDKRITIIDKANGGLSSARNVGLDIATGKYIGFVDSDDYIEKNMFEILYNACIEYESDISMVALKEINGDEIKIQENEERVLIYDKDEAIKGLLKNIKIKNYVCNKLYNSKLFKNIRFPEGQKFEDISTNIKLFKKANKLVYNTTPMYNYIIRKDSIVNSFNYDNLKDYVRATVDRYYYLLNKNSDIEPYNALAFVSNMINVYRNAIIYNIDELYGDFEKYFDLFIELVNKYKKTIFLEIADYKMLLLSIILWDKDCGKEIVKTFEEQRRLKERIIKT